MASGNEYLEKGLLIVTGSNLRAEQKDRPLAYQLKNTIEDLLKDVNLDGDVLVISDLWYLNAETLQHLPVISIGGPGVNALSAYFFKRLNNVLVVDDTLMIQMDVELEDLRASIWGYNNESTVEALDIFIQKNFLNRFLEAAVTRQL